MLQVQQQLEDNLINTLCETISGSISTANGYIKKRVRGEKNDQISMLL